MPPTAGTPLLMKFRQHDLGARMQPRLNRTSDTTSTVDGRHGWTLSNIELAHTLDLTVFADGKSVSLPILGSVQRSMMELDQATAKW